MVLFDVLRSTKSECNDTNMTTTCYRGSKTSRCSKANINTVHMICIYDVKSKRRYGGILLDKQHHGVAPIDVRNIRGESE